MPFDETESVSDALRQARRLLTERGWCKGISQDPAGRLCLFGAIREASGNLIYGAAYDHVTNLVGEIVRWNDAPERTQDEVLTLLDRASDALERV